MTPATPIAVPLSRPLLPTTDKIRPYLERIDANRWYTNYGELVRTLEHRLADHFGVRHDGVAVLCNGTLALTLALGAHKPAKASLCLMPSWTFAATPQAALAMGLTPYFADVDAQSWALTPDIAEDAVRNAPGPVGSCIVVSPFGQPVNLDAWDGFTRRTGVPVVCDAAAAFVAQKAGAVPVTISLHATKTFGVGEGGLVLSQDTRFMTDVRHGANFGLPGDGSRQALVPGTNGKMSEFQAAVGHAALDAWPQTARRFMATARAVVQSWGALPGIRFQAGFGSTWFGSTACVAFTTAESAAVTEVLQKAGIATRRWWEGCHRHPAFADMPRMNLPVTARLERHVLGLPFFIDMDAAQIAKVRDALAAALKG